LIETGFNNGSTGGFVWKNGDPNFLINLQTVSPVAINDSGEIAGSDLAGHAAVYFANGSTGDLGTLGGTWSVATAINANGQVVGQASLTGNTIAHAFLYSDGVMTDIDALDESDSIANGINASAEVVGDAAYPFIYANGTMTDLNTLIPANSGWTLEDAVGINDSGEIVGNGINADGDPDAFLLTPLVPEPGTVSLLGFGLLLLRRR
jgi:probable HAF family extracellular repeat protein